MPWGGGVAVLDDKEFSSVDQSQWLKSSKGLKKLLYQKIPVPFNLYSLPLSKQASSEYKC